MSRIIFGDLFLFRLRAAHRKLYELLWTVKRSRVMRDGDQALHNSGPEISWTPVRVFLCLYNGLTGWRYEVAQDLEAVRRGWELHLAECGGAGLLRIGFEAVQADAFDDLAKAHAGKLLLTMAAKHALPSAFRSSVFPVCEVQDQPIFLALTGWGYDFEEILRSSSPAPKSRQNEWLAAFVASTPEVESCLAGAGIVDDATYFAHEASLDRELRVRLGKARIASLLNGEEPPYFCRTGVRHDAPS